MTKRKAIGLGILVVIVLIVVYFFAIWRPHMDEVGEIARCYGRMKQVAVLVSSRGEGRNALRKSQDLSDFVKRLQDESPGAFQNDMFRCADTGREFGFSTCPEGQDPKRWILLWDDPNAHELSWRRKLVPRLGQAGYSGRRGSDPPDRRGVTVLHEWKASEFIKSLSGRAYTGCIVLYADGAIAIGKKDEVAARLRSQGCQP